MSKSPLPWCPLSLPALEPALWKRWFGAGRNLSAAKIRLVHWIMCVGGCDSDDGCVSVCHSVCVAVWARGRDFERDLT
jgi:hypothetical protein